MKKIIQILILSCIGISLFTGCSNEIKEYENTLDSKYDVQFENFEPVEELDSKYYSRLQRIGNESVFYYFDIEKQSNKDCSTHNPAGIYLKYKNKVYGENYCTVSFYNDIKKGKIAFLAEKYTLEKVVVVEDKEYSVPELAYLYFIDDDLVPIFLRYPNSKFGEDKKVIFKDNSLAEIVKNNKTVLSFNNIYIKEFAKVNDKFYFLVNNPEHSNKYIFFDEKLNSVFEINTENMLNIGPEGLKYLIKNNFTINGINDTNDIIEIKKIGRNNYFVKTSEKINKKYLYVIKNNEVILRKEMQDKLWPIFFYNDKLYEIKYDDMYKSFKFVIDNEELNDSFEGEHQIGLHNNEVVFSVSKNGFNYLLKLK